MSYIQQNYVQCCVRQVFLVKISVIVLHGYPTSARPTALIPFFHCSVCRLTNHPGHCICMQYVVVLVYLLARVVFSLASERQTDRETHILCSEGTPNQIFLLKPLNTFSDHYYFVYSLYEKNKQQFNHDRTLQFQLS